MGGRTDKSWGLFGDTSSIGYPRRHGFLGKHPPRRAIGCGGREIAVTQKNEREYSSGDGDHLHGRERPFQHRNRPAEEEL